MTAEALLASWRQTPITAGIVDFISRVTDEDRNGFVAPAERVAVFDNDGTPWCEKPIPIQLDFTLYRLAELARTDSSLGDRQPYRAALDREYHWLGEDMTKHYHGEDADLGLLMAAVESAFEGMTVQAFSEEVTTWLHDASHPVLARPYLSCAYVPMVELLRYLEASEPEKRTPTCSTSPRSSSLMMVRRSRCVSGAGSGRRPLVAASNSNGDVPMLRFARAADREALRLLVLHDDTDREFDYVTRAEEALDRAKERSWTVVSVKHDWARVFAEV
jgi:hypothetical protein